MELSRNPLKNQIDIIIVGAGIGGLNCASMLALAGKKVLVVEKNPFIGGRCAGYEKKGFKVDYGVHAFGNGQNGPLHTPIREAEKTLHFSHPLINWNVLVANFRYQRNYITTYLPMTIFHPWNYFRTAWSLMKAKVPFTDKLQLMNLNTKMKQLSAEQINQLNQVSVKEFLDRYTDSTFVHSMMALSSDSYSVVPYTQVAASDFVRVVLQAYKRGGISYPSGGCATIPNAYKQIIQAKNGSILTGQNVKQIIVDQTHSDMKAIGIKLDNGQEYMAPIIVANVQWAILYSKLLQNQYFPEAIGAKIKTLVPSYTSVVAHIALDKPLIKHKFVMRAPSLKPKDIFQRWLKGEFVKDVGCFMPIVSNIDSAMAPPGKQLALAGIGTSMEYANQKDQFVELILDYLQELVPTNDKIRDHIEWMDISGPKELDALFDENGAIIGLAQQIGQVGEHRLSSRTPLKGLYHCGDDSGTGLFGIGTELAALSGQECAKLILNDLQK